MKVHQSIPRIHKIYPSWSLETRDALQLLGFHEEAKAFKNQLPSFVSEFEKDVGWWKGKGSEDGFLDGDFYNFRMSPISQMHKVWLALTQEPKACTMAKLGWKSISIPTLSYRYSTIYAGYPYDDPMKELLRQAKYAVRWKGVTEVQPA